MVQYFGGGGEKDLFEWNETVQKMIDWIEAYLTDDPFLP